MNETVAMVIICVIAGCHGVCRWGQFTVQQTVHGSLRHLRANKWLEVLHPVILPLLGVALLVEMVLIRRSHWDWSAIFAASMWLFVFVAELINPTKPCTRCSTGFWSRLGARLRLRERSTDAGAERV